MRSKFWCTSKPLSLFWKTCLLLPSNTMYIILIYSIKAYSRCHPYLWCHVQLCENVTSALPLVFLHTFCLAKRALFVKSGAFGVVKSLFINGEKNFSLLNPLMQQQCDQFRCFSPSLACISWVVYPCLFLDAMAVYIEAWTLIEQTQALRCMSVTPCALPYPIITSKLALHQHVLKHSGILSRAGLNGKREKKKGKSVMSFTHFSFSIGMEMSWWKNAPPHYVASLWEHCIIVWSPFINWSEVLYSLRACMQCTLPEWIKGMLTVL